MKSMILLYAFLLIHLTTLLSLHVAVIPEEVVERKIFTFFPEWSVAEKTVANYVLATNPAWCGFLYVILTWRADEPRSRRGVSVGNSHLVLVMSVAAWLSWLVLP